MCYVRIWNMNNNFNSRTHVECDLVSHLRSQTSLLHFNSRTHVECDQMETRQKQLEAISTHALT